MRLIEDINGNTINVDKIISIKKSAVIDWHFVEYLVIVRTAIEDYIMYKAAPPNYSTKLDCSTKLDPKEISKRDEFYRNLVDKLARDFY